MLPIPRSPALPRSLSIILAGVLLGTAACGDTVIDPFDNEDRFFTVYGFLDVQRAAQVVRVVPVSRLPARAAAPTDGIDAIVTSTDLATGLTTSWQYTPTVYDDGTVAHLFSARFVPRSRGRYRLEIRRSDGALTTAETAVPAIDAPALFERAPVEVTEAGVTQEVYIPGVPSPGDLRVIYRFQANLVRPFRFDSLRSRVVVPYGRAGTRTDDGGWRFTLDLSADQAHVLADIESRLRSEEGIAGVLITSMGIEMKLLDAAWTLPVGEVDLDALSQPDVQTNVVNGYGFWGAVGLYVQEWGVSPQLSQWLGYP